MRKIPLILSFGALLLQHSGTRSTAESSPLHSALLLLIVLAAAVWLLRHHIRRLEFQATTWRAARTCTVLIAFMALGGSLGMA